MIGVFINVITVLIGSSIGLLFKKGIPENVSSAAMTGLGACTLYIGISGSLCGENVLILIASVVLGAIVGTLVDIDGAITRLAEKVESKFKKQDSNVSVTQGIITATLLFCVGSMTVTGSIQAGLTGDHSILITKAMLDLVSLGFLIGQSIGRWGNFFNREAFGAETDTFLRMGLMNRYTGDVTCYHPTFFYESLWNAIGFLLLHQLSKKRQYDGQIALGYAAWYGLGRAFIEGLRTDSLYWGPFRVSQLLAAVSCFAAVSVLLWLNLRPHDPSKLFVNVAAAQYADAAEESSPNDTEEEL